MNNEVYVYNTGNLTIRNSLIYSNTTIDRFSLPKQLTIPCFATLIRTSEKDILVDAGFSSEKFPAGIPCYLLGCMPEPIRPIWKYLKEQEVGEVEVYLTHLHTDHIAGLRELSEHIPIRKVYAHPGEMRCPRRHIETIMQLIVGSIPYMKIQDIATQKNSDTMELTNDGSVRLLDLTGHSNGDLGILVDGDDGQILICGDATEGVCALNHPKSTRPKYERNSDKLTKIVEEEQGIIVPSHDIYFNSCGQELFGAYREIQKEQKRILELQNSSP